nr:hypothetical protein [Tanacetum cinerariifolium]
MDWCRFFVTPVWWQPPSSINWKGDGGGLMQLPMVCSFVPTLKSNGVGFDGGLFFVGAIRDESGFVWRSLIGFKTSQLLEIESYLDEATRECVCSHGSSKSLLPGFHENCEHGRADTEAAVAVACGRDQWGRAIAASDNATSDRVSSPLADPPFEEEILAFIKKLGYSENMKSLFDAKVETLPRPWRTFGIIINKYLSGTHEGTSVIPEVPDVPTYGFDDEQISWKSSNDEDDNGQDDDNANDEEHDERNEEKLDEEEEGSDKRFHTPFYFESIDDEVTQGDNVEEGKLDEEKTNEEEEVNELYNDNINLEGRDIEMTDALLANVQATQVIEDTHVIMAVVTPKVQQHSSSVSSGFISKMLNPNPNISIDSILNLNTKSNSLVDVPVTTNDEISPSSMTTLPLPPIPLIHPVQQTHVSTPIIAPSTSLQNLPTFVLYLSLKIELRDEAQPENEDFINKIDENIKKIIKEQVKVQVSKIFPRIEKLVNEQLKAEVLTRSSNEANTSHVVAANLSELELKKILIDKMESHNSIYRSVHQKTLYKALIDAYETDIVILETYRDTVTFKRRRDDKDEDEEPSVGSNLGSKRRRFGKEPESTSAPKEKTSKSTGSSKEGFKCKTRSTDKSAQAKEEVHTHKDLEEPAHQEFKTGFSEDHVVDEISHLARKEDPRESFNELMDTPLDFSAFVLNQPNVDTLTPELLAGPIFELMKDSCKSLVELEYFLEAVYKATIDQLDWNNPEGHQYPHDLSKPLPLIPNS